MRKGLPGGELDDLGVRQHTAESPAQVLGLTARRGDRQQRLRTLATLQERGKERGTEPVDKREVGTSGGMIYRGLEALGTQKPPG